MPGTLPVNPFDTGREEYGTVNVKVLHTRVDGDTYNRYELLADGTVLTGPGASPPAAAQGADYFPETWGADPTGVADSTAAFLALYAAAGTLGGVVHGHGTYKISATLDRPKSVRLAGAQGSVSSPGFFTTFLWAGSAGGTIETIHSTGTTQPAPRDSWWKWDGGGTTSVPIASHAITCADRMDWDFGAENCAYVRFNDTAIVLTLGAVNARWDNCRFDIIANYAIFIGDDAAHGGSNDNISFSGGTWDGCGPTAGTKGFIQYAPASSTSCLGLGLEDFRIEVNGALTVPQANRPKALIALQLPSASDPVLAATVTMLNVKLTPVPAAYDCVLVGQTGVNDATTTIAAGSDTQVLPQATINVGSTSNFPAATPFATNGNPGPQIAYVTTSNGVQAVTYTGTTGSTLTGCTGGTGTMSTGGAVTTPRLSSAWVVNGIGVSISAHASAGGTRLTAGAGYAGPPSNAAYPMFSFDPMHTQGAGTNSTEFNSNIFLGPGPVIVPNAQITGGAITGLANTGGAAVGPRRGVVDTFILTALAGLGLITDTSSAEFFASTGASISTGVHAADATGGARTPKLQAAAGRAGNRHTVYKSDASVNTVTVGVQTGEKLNGVTNGTIVLSTQFAGLECISDGAGWVAFALVKGT